MGDFRASIKIQATIYDVEDSTDMWINYNGIGQDVDGVDNRISEFFRDLYERARRRYHEDLNEANRVQREREKRESELKELARLKEKYET